MGLQFHETVRGANFFDRQLPQLIKALNRVADEMEKSRLANEKKAESKPTVEGGNTNE